MGRRTTGRNAPVASRRAKGITSEQALIAIALIAGVMILAPVLFNALLMMILLLFSGCLFFAFAQFQFSERSRRGRWLNPVRDMKMRDIFRLLWRGFSLFMTMTADLISSLTQTRVPSTHHPIYEPPPNRPAQSPQAAPVSPQHTSPHEKMSRLPNGELAFQHALQAGRNVGLDIHSRVLPVDIGLMVWSHGQRSISRTAAPPDNAEYIQPFIVLHLLQRAAGRVRFEIIDADGQRLFVHEDLQNLDLGANLISPTARLKILDAHNFSGEWQLLVSADSVPLAAYNFMWYESRESILRRHLSEDGEIRVEARERLTNEDPFDRVTLDDLLADQHPDAANQRAARR